MENNERICLVVNRSASSVVYTIPEDGIRREFQPGEPKKIPFKELQKLSYQVGGPTLIANFLLIQDVAQLNDLGIEPEPEYYMTEKEIIQLMQTGSRDSWLDCLDFAPAGVIELIKKLSVSLPLADSQKRLDLKEKTGFDVNAAIKHIEEEKEEPKKESKERRVKPETPTGRRTSLPNYNVTHTGTASK